ncbi:MAG: hypothetical protein K2O36_03750 [Ruminococcus sp.]|nr:hypothetical protein [Ruminococcus sp.]
MSNCQNICRLCDRLIISNSVTVVTVDGTDTLVIDIPQRAYNNCGKYCIVVAQAIPAAATILMPVAISIGGVTTTVYPLTNSCCQQITACGIRTRTKYSTRVITTATGGQFRLLGNVCCYPSTNLTSLPVATVAAATPAVQNAIVTRSVANTATKKATATKPSTVDTLTVNAANVTVNKEDK